MSAICKFTKSQIEKNYKKYSRDYFTIMAIRLYGQGKITEEEFITLLNTIKTAYECETIDNLEDLVGECYNDRTISTDAFEMIIETLANME